MAKKEVWKTEPVASDYAAAAHFLSLSLSKDRADAVAARLGEAPLLHYRANDLLRASGLALLPPDDAEVVKDLKKVQRGRSLAPVLLVQGELGQRPLTVADGYHRICASYHLDEGSEIPCRIVGLP